ncbi:MAG: hypothetical protein HRT35_33230, partial [Algicola sp.]|nr:hypothetical protein [Algicola sp.]
MKLLKTPKALSGALVLALATAAGSLGVSTAHAENWIPIASGDMLIFIPGIQFEATKISYSDYQLSWIEQSGATSYKIERLTIDQDVVQTTALPPTKWALVDEVTTSSVVQHHNITSFELGGHQTYRLSSCVQTTCTELDTVSFLLLSADMPNTMVQNLQEDLTATATAHLTLKGGLTSARNANGKGKGNDTANGNGNGNGNNNGNPTDNPYANGFGYSMTTGHENPWGNRNENAGDNGHNGPNALSSPDTTVVTSATIELDGSYNTFLTWDEVEDATHYYVAITTKNEDGDIKKTGLRNYVIEELALSRTYKLKMAYGDYAFKVYACESNNNKNEVARYNAAPEGTLDWNDLNFERGVCGAAIEEVTIEHNRLFDTSRQARLVALMLKDDVPVGGGSEPTYSTAVNANGIIEQNKSFRLEWYLPTSIGLLKQIEVYGELRGSLGVFPYTTDLTAIDLFTINLSTDLSVAPHMIPGREYCYKIVTKYNVLDQQGQIAKYPDGSEYLVTGEIARVEPYQCIKVGNAPVLSAPQNLSIMTQVSTEDNKAHHFSWDGVAGADHYKLDRELGSGTGNWSPVYLGKDTQSIQYLPLEGNEGFRISACDTNGVCGNYSRLYFWAYNTFLTNYAETYKTPNCLMTPATATPGQSIDVLWCTPHDTTVTQYKLTNSVDAGATTINVADVVQTNQDLNYVVTAALTQGHNYCFTISALVNNTWYPREEQACTQVSMGTPGKPTITVTNATKGDFTLAWAKQDNTAWYQVQEAFCGSSCSNLTETD